MVRITDSVRFNKLRAIQGARAWAKYCRGRAAMAWSLGHKVTSAQYHAAAVEAEEAADALSQGLPLVITYTGE